MPDKISSQIKGVVRYAARISIVSRVLIISVCVSGYTFGLYGALVLFGLLLALETGLTYFLGKWCLEKLDQIDLSRRFHQCSVSSRCSLLASSNVEIRRMVEERRRERAAEAKALRESSSFRVREILAEVEGSLRRQAQ